MSFQLKGWDYTELVANLLDPDDLPLRYTQVMTIAAIYPIRREPGPDARARRRLDLDLSRPLHAGGRDRHGRDRSRRHHRGQDLFRPASRPPRVRYLDGDGRVFLNRSTDLYDLILVDAFHGGYVPFHLLTQRVLHAGQAAARARRRRRLQRARRHASSMPRRCRRCARCFPRLHLYPTGDGEVIAVVAGRCRRSSRTTLGSARPRCCRRSHGFRFPLPQLLLAAHGHADGRTAPRATLHHRRFRAGRRLRRHRAGSRAGANEVSHCREHERHSFGGTVRR